MKLRFKALAAVIGMLLSVTAFTASANADCGGLARFGLRPSTDHLSGRTSQFGRPSLLLVGEPGEPIVGFWKVTFISQGTTGIPDGAVIDRAYAQWHSDGTEIMNSSRPPVTQSFCLGVWQKAGGLHYKLNHFAVSWDTSNNLVGPANIREEVSLDQGGSSFSGTFTIDQFDQAGNLLIHITGLLSGTRITADSPASVAF